MLNPSGPYHPFSSTSAPRCPEVPFLNFEQDLWLANLKRPSWCTSRVPLLHRSSRRWRLSRDSHVAQDGALARFSLGAATSLQSWHTSNSPPSSGSEASGHRDGSRAIQRCALRAADVTSSAQSRAAFEQRTAACRASACRCCSNPARRSFLELVDLAGLGLRRCGPRQERARRRRDRCQSALSRAASDDQLVGLGRRPGGYSRGLEHTRVQGARNWRTTALCAARRKAPAPT